MTRALRSFGRKLLALALLAVAVAGLWFGIVRPVQHAFEAQAAERADLQALLARLERVSARTSALEAELAALRDTEEHAAALIAGATAPSAAATLQTDVTALIEDAGGDVRRVRVLAPESDGPLERIPLQVVMTSDTPGLRDALIAIEVDRPGLRVSRLRVQANPRAADQGSDPLTAQIELSGLRQPSRATEGDADGRR